LLKYKSERKTKIQRIGLYLNGNLPNLIPTWTPGEMDYKKNLYSYETDFIINIL